MQLLVLNSGTRCSVVIPASASVFELKEKVAQQTRVPADQQDLRLGGESLCDALSLAEQHVQNRDRLELVIVGRGQPSRSAADGRAEAEAATGAAKEVAVQQQQQLEEAFCQLDRLTTEADALEAQIGGAQKVHQELFTRVLEGLDCLALDGLTEAQRDVIRPVRKALVKRTEALSQRALQGRL